MYLYKYKYIFYLPVYTNFALRRVYFYYIMHIIKFK